MTDDSGRMTDVRRQKTDDRDQMTEIRGRMTDARKQMTEAKIQVSIQGFKGLNSQRVSGLDPNYGTRSKSDCDLLIYLNNPVNPV